MVSRSNERINMIIKLISKVLDIDEDSIRDYVIQSDTGREILDKNQAVLHDQATANACDVLSEMPKEVVNKKWDVRDIAHAYNELIMNGNGESNEARFSRFSKSEKDIVRKKRKEMRQSMKRDIEFKKEAARLAAEVE